MPSTAGAEVQPQQNNEIGVIKVLWRFQVEGRPGTPQVKQHGVIPTDQDGKNLLSLKACSAWLAKNREWMEPLVWVAIRDRDSLYGLDPVVLSSRCVKE
jgi:hypothetical protein